MYDIIDSGMVARLMIITTAGFNLAHPCYSVEYKLVSHILDPDNPYVNDNYFVMANEIDADDNIKDEAVWAKLTRLFATILRVLSPLGEGLI